MKLNCGPSSEELRQARLAKWNAAWLVKKTRLEAWHPYFALWAIRIGPRDCRIFETIERRGTWDNTNVFLGPFWTWEFRPMGNP